jgi:hypothetical protein
MRLEMRLDMERSRELQETMVIPLIISTNIVDVQTVERFCSES